MTENRKRYISLRFRVSPEEYELLKAKMNMIGATNQEAFIRKMVLDGIIIKLDVPEIKEMISLLRYSGNNINQIAKRLHETGRIYDADISDIKDNQQKLIDLANTIITKLASIK